MSAFYIDRSRPGVAPRVYHESNTTLAVALILSEDDGTVCLFPVKFEGAPYPLTGASMIFPNEEAVSDFLGIEQRAEAA